MKKDTRIHLIPAEGLKVRDPERGGHLAAEGRPVELTPYWRRRRDKGDVVEGKHAKTTKTKEQ